MTHIMSNLILYYYKLDVTWSDLCLKCKVDGE